MGGDAGALYLALSRPVLGYFRAQRAADPEDLVGEVFVQVARDLPRFHGDDAARRRWVFSIAHNRLVDSWRRRAVRPVLADAEVPDVAAADEVATLDPTLVAALHRLTDDQREVIVLRFVADLSIRDVAHITKRRQGAVKALQTRGLAALARELDPGRPR
jgi:RNA polymerase sigma-70 factor (ECF subfamily)